LPNDAQARQVGDEVELYPALSAKPLNAFESTSVQEIGTAAHQYPINPNAMHAEFIDNRGEISRATHNLDLRHRSPMHSSPVIEDRHYAAAAGSTSLNEADEGGGDMIRPDHDNVFDCLWWSPSNDSLAYEKQPRDGSHSQKAGD